jgi:hypothetical protein
LKNFIDTIKNGIVCLQIAKANRDPNNGGLLHTAEELREILSKLNHAQGMLLIIAERECSRPEPWLCVFFLRRRVHSISERSDAEAGKR